MTKRDPASIHFDEDTVVEDIDLDDEEIIIDGERLTDERAEQINAEVLKRVGAAAPLPRQAKGDNHNGTQIRPDHR